MLSAASQPPSDQDTAIESLLSSPSTGSTSTSAQTVSSDQNGSGSSTQGGKSSEKPIDTGSAGGTAQWLAQSLIPALSIPPAATPADTGTPAGGDGKAVSDSADASRAGVRDSLAEMLWSQTAGTIPLGGSSASSTPQAAGLDGSSGSPAGGAGSSSSTSSGSTSSGDAGGSGSTSGSSGAGSASLGSSTSGGPQSTLQLLTLLTGAAAGSTDQSSGATQGDTSSAAGKSPLGAPSTAPDPQSLAAAGARLTAPMAVPANPPFMSSELKSPVGTAPWVDELGTHLTWMAQQGIGSASLHLSPAELGPIEARISIRGTEATVWFGAAHPDTRAALEQALPRLRTMFATQGMALADSGVFREAPRQPQREPALPGVSGLPSRSASPVASSATATRLGLLDLYA